MSSPPQYGQQQGGYPPQGGAVVYQQQQPTVLMQSGQLPPESFVGQIIFSCIATWCCFCPLGLTAFILAMVAQNKSTTNKAEAHRLGLVSYVLSGLAVVVGIIIIIVWVALHFTAASQH